MSHYNLHRAPILLRRPILSPLAALALAALLSACASGGDQESLSGDVGRETDPLSGFEHPGRVPPDSDLTAPPEAGGVGLWIMGDQWRTDVWPPLFQGAEASVAISPDRANATPCGPDPTVTAYVATPNGDVVTVPMVWNGAVSGSFRVPEGVRSLSLWIKIEGPDGCVAYDSDYGRNFTIPVYRWAPVRVRFGAGGDPVADGPLVRGGVVALEYAHERLPNCRIIYRGFPGWDIIAHAVFDGVAVPGASVVLRGNGGGNGTFPVALAYFPIPWEASELQLWFENNEYPPLCTEWDSKGGANYRFPLSPMNGTPPSARLVFGPGWVEHATGPLFGGASLTVEASPDRFPTCGTSGEVMVNLRTVSGEVVTLGLGGWTASGARQGSILLPPDAGHVEMWLYTTRADGCREYDSDYGANYGFDVRAW
jgi:hypothetical protein